ncbi:hypothetical protein [Microbacterium hominis]|uniref:hypothetical protein n=1 Tax=Microbacterium hominis TaxID=162426 RepID=UPI0007686450|nr:hypothetical protein [Microbacterium hominis]KXC05703.1 peptide ABC transporter permease [Microbacterium hominis]
MSVLALASAPTGRVTWAAVSDGFYVASRVGDYVGCVECTPDGHFVGFDFRSTPVGRYASLGEAQRAVGGAHEARPLAAEEKRSKSRRWPGLTAVGIGGVVALGALATAVLTTPLV